MTVDRERLIGADALPDTLVRLREAIQPTREVRGWATVELDRAERELLVHAQTSSDSAAPTATPASSAATPAAVPATADTVLGAHARLMELSGDELIVLLEPSTEGRLAAALARHGEGYLVRYVLAGPGAAGLARAAGFQITAAAPGPLGQERLVLGGPREGPFIVLVEA